MHIDKHQQWLQKGTITVDFPGRVTSADMNEVEGYLMDKCTGFMLMNDWFIYLCEDGTYLGGSSNALASTSPVPSKPVKCVKAWSTHRSVDGEVKISILNHYEVRVRN